jgi:DNA-binding response OmpR family regulator
VSKSPVALIVDDSPEMLMVLASLCRRLGFDVMTVRDGASALSAAAEHHPDLVCLDLMLPTLSGLEVCERLKASPDTADIPVIVASARTYPQDRAEAELAGADEYITKPIDPDLFSSRVRALLWQRRKPTDS